MNGGSDFTRHLFATVCCEGMAGAIGAAFWIASRATLLGPSVPVTMGKRAPEVEQFQEVGT